MTILQLGPFSGLAPRYSKSRTDAQYADEAVDVDLSDDTLRPLYQNKEVATTATGNGYFCGCDFIDLQPCETASTLIHTCRTEVISGVNAATIGACGTDRCDLQVKCPTTSLTVATSSPSVAEDVARTQYAYTFVTSNGHETSLSYPSGPVPYQPNDPHILSDFEVPPETACVEEVVIYRLMTGYRSGTEEQREDITGWIEVGRVPAGTAVATIDIEDQYAGPANTTEGRRHAPDGLTDVYAFGDAGGLIGRTANAVHQSVPGMPHWWPVEFQTDLHHSINGLAVHKQFALAFTHEATFLIRPGTTEPLTCTPPRVLMDLPTPLILRDNKRWQATATSIIYVSDEGLIEVSADGQYQNITEPWFSIHEWRKMAPETMRCGYTRQHVLFTSDTHSFMLNYSARAQQQQLVRITDTPDRYLDSPTGELLLIENGAVSQFGAGDLSRTGKWSKIVTTPPTRFRFAELSVGGLSTLKINDMTTTMAGENHRLRLCKYAKSRRQAICIETNDEVYKLNLTSSAGELSNAQF